MRLDKALTVLEKAEVELEEAEKAPSLREFDRACEMSAYMDYETRQVMMRKASDDSARARHRVIAARVAVQKARKSLVNEIEERL